MVLGLITAVAACPAIIGTTEAVRQGQKQNQKEKHRSQKMNLVASCSTARSSKKPVIDGGFVVLRKNKLYIDVPADEELEFDKPSGHLFAGYFLGHPVFKWGWRGEAMVSTIMDEPPQLNWIYVDVDTYELKYGNKVESEGHILGPWDCTKTERRLTLEGWEGFVAVKEGPDTWALYFDRDDDGLKGKMTGKKVVEIELTRKERKKTKEHADEKDYI